MVELRIIFIRRKSLGPTLQLIFFITILINISFIIMLVWLSWNHLESLPFWAKRRQLGSGKKRARYLYHRILNSFSPQESSDVYLTINFFYHNTYQYIFHHYASVAQLEPFGVLALLGKKATIRFRQKTSKIPLSSNSKLFLSARIF